MQLKFRTQRKSKFIQFGHIAQPKLTTNPQKMKIIKVVVPYPLHSKLDVFSLMEEGPLVIAAWWPVVAKFSNFLVEELPECFAHEVFDEMPDKILCGVRLIFHLGFYENRIRNGLFLNSLDILSAWLHIKSVSQIPTSFLILSSQQIVNRNFLSSLSDLNSHYSLPSLTSQ